ncbi:hypothetical protein HHO41_06440 [Bacillus sp. DNRA2]|uniref:hypothetical protein n=1 Tax=Bacillus sp. DNRA2 TaxID=2723053 RepID=UPI00145D126F|nr:hypothetical protein [Bacillus sp. DNRA2]NMD69921.1 hypothetical protein [Bacillus sp. DNRA2]
MSLEWFDRVCGELQDHLESICAKYDQVGNMTVERGAKYPRIEFFVETEGEERVYFCTLSYDPAHEDFFFETFAPELGQTSRVVLYDIEDIVDAVHESLHDFINEEDIDNVIVEDNIEEDEEHDIFEEIEVEWETPEVTAYLEEDEVEVTYQFGIVTETGDGVLKRINRIWTDDDELIKDESNFIFSKEEASTIIAMIASNLDKMTNFDYS